MAPEQLEKLEKRRRIRVLRHCQVPLLLPVNAFVKSANLSSVDNLQMLLLLEILQQMTGLTKLERMLIRRLARLMEQILKHDPQLQ